MNYELRITNLNGSPIVSTLKTNKLILGNPGRG